MSLSSRTDWDLDQRPPFPVRRFTVEEYHRLGEALLLTEDDQVELLEGWIVPKMHRNPRHDASLHRALDCLNGRLPAQWCVRIQTAVTTGDSEPEPDLAVVRRSADHYASSHPTPTDVAIVVEISDTSLRHDQTVKARIYARAGIACYWIVNLIDAQIEVFRRPRVGGVTAEYAEHFVYALSDSVPLAIDGASLSDIPVRSILP
jgi:Uma2 family endonuclease